MKEAELETPFLDAEIAAVVGRRAERNKTEEEILELRERLGEIMRKNVNFPDEVEGKKIELVPGFSSKADWVDNGSASYQELSATTLICKPIKQGKQMNIILSSDLYPSGNQVDIYNPKSRQADFRVFVEGLDYYFYLGRKGDASIRMLEGTDTEKRTPKNMRKTRIRILRDTLNLIENSKTDFFAANYSLGNKYKKSLVK